MEHDGPYSPPTGGNSLGDEGACKAPGLRATAGSIPAPPTDDKLKRRLARFHELL